MKKKKDNTEGARELLTALVGHEQLEIMAVMVKKMGIMIAVRNLNGSKDFDAITTEIRKDKPWAPAKFVRQVVELHYPELVEEKMIDKKGRLTPEALMVANEYDLMLNEDKRNAN